MGSFSIFHWLLVLVVILILFGAGRLPSVMGDFAKGIKAFRSGLKEDDDKGATPAASSPQPTVTAQSHATAANATTSGHASTTQTADPKVGVPVPPSAC